MLELLTSNGEEPILLIIVVSVFAVAILFALLWWASRKLDVPTQLAVSFEPELEDYENIVIIQELKKPNISSKIPFAHPNDHPIDPLLPVLLESIVSTPNIIEAAKPDSLMNPKYSFSLGTARGVEIHHQLNHFRLARKTGGGKTYSMARVLSQLIARGVDVYYINPKYMPIDQEDPNKVNLNPILHRCKKVAIDTEGKDCLILLEEARTIMFDRIKQAREHEDIQFVPIVVIVDELSSLESAWGALEDTKVAGWKNARKRGRRAIDLLLRWGRQPRVFYGTTSQDAQAQNGPTNTGTAGNFGVSACHPSLDRFSLLNILGDIDPKTLPLPQSPYQWWVVSANGVGVDQVDLIDFPAVSNDWIDETIGAIPIVPPDDQKPRVEQTDSAMNQRPKTHAIATEMLQKWNGGSIAQAAVPASDAEHKPVPSKPVEQDGTEEDRPVPLNDHIRAAFIFYNNPGISQRDMAWRLWKKRDGRWNQKAGILMDEMKKVMERNEINGTTAS